MTNKQYEELSINYYEYSNTLIFKILINILPDKFLKSITYNALVDYKITLSDTVRIQNKTIFKLEEIELNNNEVFNCLADTYELDETKNKPKETK